MNTARQNLRIQKFVAAFAVLLFVLKIIAYYLTHSLAILTDALESIVNVLAGFIGLYSLYIAAKPKDTEHPYGHGKAEFISSAIEGGLIISAGILIIYEMIQNLIERKPVEELGNGLLLITLTAVLNFIAGTLCLRLGKKNRSLALEASGRHMQLDTYSTLVIMGALLLMIATAQYWIDKGVALVMGLFIMYSGYRIIRRSLAGIMDEADKELLLQLVQLLNTHRRENWIDLHNLRVIKYGSVLHIDCHLTVPWYLNIHEAHAEIEMLAGLVKKEFDESVEFFVHTDGCLDFSCSICTREDCSVRQHPFQKTISWTLDNLITDKKHQL